MLRPYKENIFLMCSASCVIECTVNVFCQLCNKVYTVNGSILCVLFYLCSIKMALILNLPIFFLMGAILFVTMEMGSGRKHFNIYFTQ